MRAELARVLPSLSEYAGASPVRSRTSATAPTARCGELLERLAATKPLVLVLDDVHWADSASIDLLGALLRRPPAAAVLLALGARPRQLPERLAGALERAHRAGALDAARARARSGATRPRSCSAKASTARSPTRSTRRAAATRSTWSSSRGRRTAAARARRRATLSLGGVEVPRGRGRRAHGGARRCCPSRRAPLLDGAAVAGDPFEPDLAAAAAGVDEDAAVAGARRAARADLVRRTDVPRRFRFRHPLVRRPSTRRRPAAGGSARTSAARRRSPSAARRAGARTPRGARRRARRPGRARRAARGRRGVMLRAPASAARWFGAALRLLPDERRSRGAAGAALARAAALAATAASSRRAARPRRERSRWCPTTRSRCWVRLTVACAGVEHFLGRHDLARTRLAEALERLPDRATPEGVALMLELAIDGMFRADYVATRRWAVRALEAARPLGDTPLVATAGAIVMLGGACSGEVAEAESC